MKRKILLSCLLTASSLALSVAGGCMVLRCFALAAYVSVQYLTFASIVWIAGTGISVLGILMTTYYLIHTEKENTFIPKKNKPNHKKG